MSRKAVGQFGDTVGNRLIRGTPQMDSIIARVIPPDSSREPAFSSGGGDVKPLLK